VSFIRRSWKGNETIADVAYGINMDNAEKNLSGAIENLDRLLMIGQKDLVIKLKAIHLELRKRIKDAGD